MEIQEKRETRVVIKITKQEHETLLARIADMGWPKPSLSDYVRGKIFTGEEPDNALVEQLNIRICEKDAIIVHLQRQNEALVEQARNQQLLQAQAQALLKDKSLPWYRRIFGKRVTATSETETTM